MTLASDEFLASFNRIEKWLQKELPGDERFGFSELVRRASKQKISVIEEYEDDLLQIAQLRNAIIHDRISPDFVIAEPNEWVLNRLIEIEKRLTHPEMVVPRYEKYVTGFEEDIPLTELLKIVAQHGYSQFPIYRKGTFLGLITAHGLGIWMAKQHKNDCLQIGGLQAKDVLISDRRSQNFRFASATTFVYEVTRWFHTNPSLEAVLITRDGKPNGNLLGIIRPKDVFQNEWRN